MLVCVVLILKCAFELGFKVWNKSNYDIIDKFVVRWRLVVSRIKWYFFSGRVKVGKINLTVN